MLEANVTFHRSFTVGSVPRRLFGSFVEHMGRCVYGGIYEPGHPTADDAGFRGDVLELAAELGASVVRYPGGNFVSGYRWEDGIGPPGERPVRVDRAWRSVETNRVGIDEFMAWVRRLGAEPMLAVNLGTRGVDAACDLLEYTNVAGGTALSHRRAKNGAAEPYDVRLWCLGNELDGPWQIGHKTAYEYGRLARETAHAMRRVDPSIELVACGSSNSGMPTFGEWERTVLEEAYEQVDYVSLHAYYEPVGGDVASFLASAVDMGRMIDGVAATADAVRSKLRSGKRIQLSFDEWNVWYQSRFSGEAALELVERRHLIEDDYNALDAVVVGSLLACLLRHSDRVRVACQAQLVNVIAPIRTDPGGPAWRQSIFDPFALTARFATGEVLSAAVTSPCHDTARFGEVATLDAVATLDDDAGACTVIVVNRSPDESVATTVILPSGSWRAGVHHLVEASTTAVVDSAAQAGAVRARTTTPPEPQEGQLTIVVPPASWHLLRFVDRGA